MPNKYHGSTKEAIERTERDYGDILDDPAISSFTDWALPNDALELNNESILKFEEEHGESFYRTFREIVKK